MTLYLLFANNTYSQIQKDSDKLTAKDVQDRLRQLSMTQMFILMFYMFVFTYFSDIKIIETKNDKRGILRSFPNIFKNIRRDTTPKSVMPKISNMLSRTGELKPLPGILSLVNNNSILDLKALPDIMNHLTIQ
jgi:hypothetical protein